MGGKASHWSARSCDQHNCPPSRASRYRYGRVNGPPGGGGGREGVGVHLRNRVTARNRKNPLIAVIMSNPSSYLHLEYSQVYHSFSPSQDKMQCAQKGLNIRPFYSLRAALCKTHYNIEVFYDLNIITWPSSLNKRLHLLHHFTSSFSPSSLR